MPRKKSEVRSQKSEVGRAKAHTQKGKRLKGEEAKREDERHAASHPPSSPLNLFPSSPTRRGPSVAVVGAGRLGAALAVALGECGYEVVALVSRRAARARRAAGLLRAGARALSFEQLGELPPTDLVFIATPDDAIAETARALSSAPALSNSTPALPSSTPTTAPTRRVRTAALANSRAGRAPRRVVLHTSGALSSEVLAPLGANGFAVGSLHPLVSVSDAAAGALALRGAFYCVEGDAAASRAARRVVSDLGGHAFSIRARDKALYHAAAVITSGHTVALFDTAARLLARCGLTDTRARAVLLPLLRSTLDNLSTRSPARALTGTFSRADVATVRKHLAALAATGDHEGAAVYTLLGRLSLRLSAEAGADARALGEIARILESER